MRGDADSVIGCLLLWHCAMYRRLSLWICKSFSFAIAKIAKLTFTFLGHGLNE